MDLATGLFISAFGVGGILTIFCLGLWCGRNQQRANDVVEFCPKLTDGKSQRELEEIARRLYWDEFTGDNAYLCGQLHDELSELEDALKVSGLKLEDFGIPNDGLPYIKERLANLAKRFRDMENLHTRKQQA